MGLGHLDARAGTGDDHEGKGRHEQPRLIFRIFNTPPHCYTTHIQKMEKICSCVAIAGKD
jgi:hypothetical protein